MYNLAVVNYIHVQIFHREVIKQVIQIHLKNST
jgi:hypothetical protein